MGSSLVHLWYKERNSSHQLGGSPHLCGVWPDPVLWLFQWVWHVALAPLVAVEHCWSPFLFKVVLLGCIGDMWLQGRQTLSITSFISGNFRSFKDASQVRRQLQCIIQIIWAWEVKLHQLLCWALGWALDSWFPRIKEPCSVHQSNSWLGQASSQPWEFLVGLWLRAARRVM